MSLAGLVVGGAAALAVALLITLAAGRQRFRARVSREIHMLVAGARSLGADELAARWDGLPEPVRCHLRHAIPPGAPALRSARLLHHGTFRPSRLRRWFPIRGEEYFTPARPARQHAGQAGVGGFRVPTSVEVAWVFGGRETPYARFQIRRLEYNVEQRFAAR